MPRMAFFGTKNDHNDYMFDGNFKFRSSQGQLTPEMSKTEDDMNSYGMYAGVAMDQAAYDLWDQSLKDDKHKVKQQILDIYLEDKTTRNTSFLDGEKFNGHVQDIFENLESSMMMLRKKNEIGLIEVDRLFANEVNIFVQDVGTYQIYVDSDN
jgi:hypothetical protein